jgi:hypothetical protein
MAENWERASAWLNLTPFSYCVLSNGVREGRLAAVEALHGSNGKATTNGERDYRDCSALWCLCGGICEFTRNTVIFIDKKRRATPFTRKLARKHHIAAREKQSQALKNRGFREKYSKYAQWLSTPRNYHTSFWHYQNRNFRLIEFYEIC